jgi:hypothetical protein
MVALTIRVNCGAFARQITVMQRIYHQLEAKTIVQLTVVQMVQNALTHMIHTSVFVRHGINNVLKWAWKAAMKELVLEIVVVCKFALTAAFVKNKLMVCVDVFARLDIPVRHVKYAIVAKLLSAKTMVFAKITRVFVHVVVQQVNFDKKSFQF